MCPRSLRELTSLLWVSGPKLFSTLCVCVCVCVCKKEGSNFSLTSYRLRDTLGKSLGLYGASVSSSAKWG